MAKLTTKTKKKAVKALAVLKAAVKRSQRIELPPVSSGAARVAKKKTKVAMTATKPVNAHAMPSKRFSKIEVTATSRFISQSAVSHRMFGPGTVLSVDGDKLEIKFKSVGVKWIVDSYVSRA